MANHKSAIKRHRQSLVRREKNKAGKTRMKTAVKALYQVLETKDTEQIQRTVTPYAILIRNAPSEGLLLYFFFYVQADSLLHNPGQSYSPT